MRSAECGIAMGGRSPNEGRAAIPHSAFRTPHWDGRRGEVKIAVVFDTLHPDWEDADYKKEVDAKVEEAEYDVARALMAQEHDVLMVGVADQLAPVLERLAKFQPKLVFNGCESFRGHARHEYALATVLEMHGYRYTGSSPTGPLIVKPLLEDASVGIAQASVVEDDEELGVRVKFIHEKFHQAAIVEELIEGRELYVGLIGNGTIQVLPIVELTFGESDGEHRIATYKAKWDEEYRKRKKIKNVFAKGLSDEVAAKIADTCTTAFHALWLHDYGRVDLRLTHDDAVYVLEVNPNPFLAQENEMADAAEKAGMTYNAFIQRIVEEALARGAA